MVKKKGKIPDQMITKQDNEYDQIFNASFHSIHFYLKLLTQFGLNQTHIEVPSLS